MSNLNQNFIAGEWLAGVGEIDNINPSDLSDTIGRYAQADDTQLQRALDAAETAQREWARAGLERRYNVLMAIGNELIARCDGARGRPARWRCVEFRVARGERRAAEEVRPLGLAVLAVVGTPLALHDRRNR